MWPDFLFIKSFGGINLLLLISYYVLKVNAEDFGAVPVQLHTYMLFSAFLAYACNLFLTIRISKSGASDSTFQLASLSYYVLQLLFIPFVRTAPGNAVRILLGLSCIPIWVLHKYSRNTTERILSLSVFAHVFVNDFILFGAMH